MFNQGLTAPLTAEQIAELAERAHAARGTVLTATSVAASGHPGGSFSAARVGAAAARREPISDQTEIDREHGAVDYQSAADSQAQEDSPPLFEQDALERFRSSWGAIQTGFVDNPGGAVKQADELVAAVMKRLAEVFADEHHGVVLGAGADAEDLGVAGMRAAGLVDRWEIWRHPTGGRALS